MYFISRIFRQLINKMVSQNNIVVRANMILLSMLLILSLSGQAEGTAKVFIKFQEYLNPSSLKSNGLCCDGELSANRTCTGDCDYYINVCLGTSPTAPCNYKTTDLGYFKAEDSRLDFPVTFLDGHANPVPFDFEAWPGSVYITISIYDQDTSRKEEVDTLRFGFQPSTPIKNSGHELIYQSYNLTGTRSVQPSRMTVYVAARCNQFFYGDSCNVKCLPSDDCGGHYKCDVTDGHKICLDGWGGANCDVALSSDFGCSHDKCSNHGTCITYGNKTDQFYCCCQEGYDGDTCSLDVDECAAFPCQHGGRCVQLTPPGFVCHCNIRWKGSLCQKSVTCDDNPCQNGGRCIRLTQLSEESFYCACDESIAAGDICENIVSTTTSSTTTPTMATSSPNAIFTSRFTNGTSTTSLSSFSSSSSPRVSRDPTITPLPSSSSLPSSVSSSLSSLPAQGKTSASSTSPTSSASSTKGETMTTSMIHPNTSQIATSPQSVQTSPTARTILTTVTSPLSFLSSSPPSTLYPVTSYPNNGCFGHYYGKDCNTYCKPVDDCSGHYSCNQTTGQKMCLSDWTGLNCRVPMIPELDCTCQNGGVCFNGRCCCPESYKGNSCETESDFCIMNVCMNGGQCLNDRCNCRDGFKGQYCEIMAYPNRNCKQYYFGPSCKVFCRPQVGCSGNSQYTCNEITGEKICGYGYKGIDCDQKYSNAQHFSSPCPNSICRNGGVCNNGTCCCPPTYTGSLCHVKKLACQSSPCLNGGLCHNEALGYKCTCQASYTGLNCEYFVEKVNVIQSTPRSTKVFHPCDSFPCGGNGECIRNGASYSCLCTERYVGDRCETFIPDIKLVSNKCPEFTYGPNCDIQCQERNSCDGHYYCNSLTGYKICMSGWAGENCNIRTIPPSEDPECPSDVTSCLNNGTCFQNRCCCDANHIGDHCQEGVLACASYPCGTVGTCRDLETGFHCDCLDGYSGDLCQYFIGTTTKSSTQPPTASRNNTGTSSATGNTVTPTTTTTTMSTSTTIRYDPDKIEPCGKYFCFNGGQCFFTTLKSICRCPSFPNMDPYCQFIPTSPPSTTFNVNSMQTTVSASDIFNSRKMSTQPTSIQTLTTSTFFTGDLSPTVSANHHETTAVLATVNPSQTYGTTGSSQWLSTINPSQKTNSLTESLTTSTNGISQVLGSESITPTVILHTAITDLPQSYTLLSNSDVTTYSSQHNIIHSSKTIHMSEGPMASTSTIVGPHPNPPVVSDSELHPSSTLEITHPVEQTQHTMTLTPSLSSPYGDFISTEEPPMFSSDIIDSLHSSLINNVAPMGQHPTDHPITSTQMLEFISPTSIQVIDSSSNSVSSAMHSPIIPSASGTSMSSSFVVSSVAATEQPPTHIKPTVGKASSSPTTTDNPNYITGIVYIQNPLQTSDYPVIIQLVFTVLRTRVTEFKCCFDVIRDHNSTLVDIYGIPVTKVQYRFTPASLDRTKSVSLNHTGILNAIDTDLNNILRFQKDGIRVYRGPLFNPSNLFHVDLAGMIFEEFYPQVADAIVSSWKKHNPDCKCSITVDIISSRPYVGQYGTKLTRIFYIVLKDGARQSMTSSFKPEQLPLNQALNKNIDFTSVYARTDAYPYDYSYELPLSTQLGQNTTKYLTVMDTIKTYWKRYLQFGGWCDLTNVVPCPIRISSLREEMHHDRNGKVLTSLRYFVYLKGRLINHFIMDGPRQDTFRSSTESCGCVHKLVREITVKDNIGYAKAMAVINGAVGLGTDMASIVEKQLCYDPSGHLATRLFYLPTNFNTDTDDFSEIQRRISDKNDVLAVSAGILVQYQHSITLMGNITRQQSGDMLGELIKKAWILKNSEAMKDYIYITPTDIAIRIKDFNGNTYISIRGEPVTVVRYVASIDGVDSSLTAAQPPDADTLTAVLMSVVRGPRRCEIPVSKKHWIHIRGKMDSSNQTHVAILDRALTNAWKQANPGYPGDVIAKTYNISLDSSESSSVLDRIVNFTISLPAGIPGFTDRDLTPPSKRVIENKLHADSKGFVDVVVIEEEPHHKADDDGDDDSDDFPWYIPVGIIVAIILIIIIVVIVWYILRDSRHRKLRNMQKTLRRYDREHFSAEPDIPNPTFAPDDPDMDESNASTYYVTTTKRKNSKQINNDPGIYLESNFDKEHFTSEPAVACENNALRGLHNNGYSSGNGTTGTGWYEINPHTLDGRSEL